MRTQSRSGNIRGGGLGSWFSDSFSSINWDPMASPITQQAVSYVAPVINYALAPVSQATGVNVTTTSLISALNPLDSPAPQTIKATAPMTLAPAPAPAPVTTAPKTTTAALTTAAPAAPTAAELQKALAAEKEQTQKYMLYGGGALLALGLGYLAFRPRR